MDLEDSRKLLSKFKKLAKAKELAKEKHYGQKYGEYDYIYHVEQVASLARKHYPNKIEYEIVAYLHDVVEDTDITNSDINFIFGYFISKNIAILNDEEGVNRKERKLKTNKKLLNSDDECYVGLAVKILDRMANMEESIVKSNKSKFKMYEKENLEFKKAVRRDYNENLIKELDNIVLKGSKKFNRSVRP